VKVVAQQNIKHKKSPQFLVGFNFGVQLGRYKILHYKLLNIEKLIIFATNF